MLTRSTSSPIDGWISPSREFPDKSLQECRKRQPLAPQKKSSIVRHQRVEERGGAYRMLSFATEPIQPPIVPLSLFLPQSLQHHRSA